jgi:hypothetical protein
VIALELETRTLVGLNPSPESVMSIIGGGSIQGRPDTDTPVRIPKAGHDDLPDVLIGHAVTGDLEVGEADVSGTGWAVAACPFANPFEDNIRNVHS